MSGFVKLLVNLGPPHGVVEFDMVGAKTLRYAALDVADRLKLDTDEFRWFLLNPETKKVRPLNSIAAELEGVVSELACQPLNATALPEGA